MKLMNVDEPGVTKGWSIMVRTHLHSSPVVHTLFPLHRRNRSPQENTVATMLSQQIESNNHLQQSFSRRTSTTETCDHVFCDKHNITLAFQTDHRCSEAFSATLEARKRPKPPKPPGARAMARACTTSPRCLRHTQ